MRVGEGGLNGYARYCFPVAVTAVSHRWAWILHNLLRGGYDESERPLMVKGVLWC